MKINEKIKKCVAFLQYKMANGTFNYAGTCFFVCIERNGQKHVSVVTATHVLNGVKKLGLDEIFIRLNLKNGETETRGLKIDAWKAHPDNKVDISATGFNLNDNHDHLYYPQTSFMTNDLVKQNEIDCGDEVFITGLFKHHTGNIRNSPIVRIGNIALMPSENIQIDDHFIDAYLIESRSIGGLSGSPVFVNLGDVRKLGNQIKHAEGEHIPLLFGIVHGHFDSKAGEIDAVTSTGDQEKINVGIAIVTPVAKLAEMFDLVNPIG